VSVAFFVPLFAADLFESLLGSLGAIGGLLVGFAFYLVQYVVIFYANAALVGAATIRLEGGDPTVGDGLRIASQHAPGILGYAAVAATVGLFLNRASRKRSGLVRFLASLAGMAWNVASFLVVPVLVNEGIGPWDAVKRSASLLRQTWGEQISGTVSMNAVFALLGIGALVVGGGLIALAISMEAWPLAIAIGALLVLTWLGLALINSTLNGIFRAAVYHYATTGHGGGFYDEGLVASAFQRG
ncbi:MAG: DUF6159 family protein, partial [Anaerolineae bacterium]